MALQVTARFSFLLFWSAYAAGAMTALFGPALSRSSGVRVSLVSPLLLRTLFTSRLLPGLPTLDTYQLAGVCLFRGRRFMDLPSGIVLDPSPSTSAWIQGLVVLARDRAQLHCLCFRERFFEISGIW